MKSHISLQVVREALRALTAAGLVRRVRPAGSARPHLAASDDHGFSTDEAEVISWGLCPDCSTAPSS